MPKKYSEEFKTEAVRLMKEKGLSLQQASQELGVNRVSLQKWCEEEHKDPSLELLQKELHHLQKENKQLLMEREILKKATTFFAKELK